MDSVRSRPCWRRLSRGNLDAFWRQWLSGLLDLYELAVVPIGTNGVQATLKFGESSDLFALSFLNHDGTPFDPSSPTDVGAIEQEIENAFTDRALTTNLDDLFTVAFVPQPGVNEYTFGSAQSADANGVEPGIPEPSTWAMLTIGFVGLGSAAFRRNQKSSIEFVAVCSNAVPPMVAAGGRFQAACARGITGITMRITD